MEEEAPGVAAAAAAAEEEAAAGRLVGGSLGGDMKDLGPGVEEEEEEEEAWRLLAGGGGDMSASPSLLLSSLMLRRLRMAASEEGKLEALKEGREAAAAGVLVVPDPLPTPFFAKVASSAPREERLRRAWYCGKEGAMVSFVCGHPYSSTFTIHST
jgi:hypothetical protein